MGENGISPAEGNLPTCNVKKEIVELKELMVNVTKEIKAMWKYMKEQHTPKNVSANQLTNECKSHCICIYSIYLRFSCEDHLNDNITSSVEFLCSKISSYST